MTDTAVEVETVAQRIAERGHEALVARMRKAYADAAAAHADLISLDDERIEAMVQAAAEHADGLQWRRALAEVGADELGISVSDALKHPAVTRAQSLAGAPSYEQSLAEIIARPVPPAADVPPAANVPPAAEVPSGADVLPEPEPPTPEPEAEPEPAPPTPEPPATGPRSVSAADSELPPTAEHDALSTVEPAGAEASAAAEAEEPEAGEPAIAAADELETVEADDVVLELLPEPDPIEYETQAYDVEDSFAEEEQQPVPESEHWPTPESQQPPTPEPAPQPEPAAQPEPGPEAEAEPEPEAEAETEHSIEFHEEQPELVIPAIHLGGVANLPTKREGLGVRLSADGLDILQGERDIIGRLVWEEIEKLEVPHHRGLLRRSEQRARLLVRTPHGDASFDVPGFSPDELRDGVEPLVQLYGRH